MEWYRGLRRINKVIVWLAVIVLAIFILGAISAPPEESQTQSSEVSTQNESNQQSNEDRQSQQQAIERAQQEADAARAEAEAAQEEAAQARQEAEDARAAQEEAESAPPPQQNQEQQNQQGDSGGSTATIRVTGGIPFSGSYGNIDTTQSVDGVAPTEYEVPYDSGFLSMDSVTAVMQKNGVGGTLGVQIVVDGEVVKETETSAQYGVAQVTWTPGE